MTTPTAPTLRLRPRTAALAALLALGAALAPVGAAHAADAGGGDDVTWSVRTAANELGSDRTSYGYAVNPGSTTEDALVIANRGTEPLELGVYAADGYTTDSGQFDLVVAGAESVGVGAWVHADADRVTVAPGDTAEVPFTVSVPDNATPGDYAGGIVTSLTQPDDAQGINVDRRLGIRIALRVGGELAPALAVEDVHVSWDGGLDPLAGGDATLGYTLRNTGNTVLGAQQSARITGPFGWFPVDAGAIEEPPQLLPGETWTVRVPVHDVPAEFRLTATATVTPIVIDASGSTVTIEPISASADGWALPWMLLLIVLVLAAAAVTTILLRRRARAAARAREDARVREAVEAALAEAEAAAPAGR